MYVISASKKKGSYGPAVGTYQSTVTAISYDEAYADGDAFRVEYELISSNGERKPYTELFHNTTENERTAQFLEYLKENGVQFADNGLPDLVGKRETVVLKKRVGYFRPVIVERSFAAGNEAMLLG